MGHFTVTKSARFDTNGTVAITIVDAQEASGFHHVDYGGDSFHMADARARLRPSTLVHIGWESAEEKLEETVTAYESRFEFWVDEKAARRAGFVLSKAEKARCEKQAAKGRAAEAELAAFPKWSALKSRTKACGGCGSKLAVAFLADGTRNCPLCRASLLSDTQKGKEARLEAAIKAGRKAARALSPGNLAPVEWGTLERKGVKTSALNVMFGTDFHC